MPEQPITQATEFDPEDEYRPEPEPEPQPPSWMDGSVRIGIHTSIAGSYLNALEAARKLGLDARVMDGENLSFVSEFDAVFSNAALHWMRSPEAVIAGVWRALRPAGRFVGEFGGHGCVAKIRKALVDALNRRGIDGEAAVPWYFPTVEEYSARLKKAGFSTDYIALIPRPTPLPGDVTGWLETFGESFTACLPPSERPAYVAEVREALLPELSDAGGKWTADYVRLRFAAAKQV